MNKSQQGKTMDQFTQDIMGPGYSRSSMKGQGGIGQRLLGSSGQSQSVQPGGRAPGQPTSMGTPATAPAAPAPRYNQTQAAPLYGSNDMSALDIYKPNPKSSYRPSMLDVQDRGSQFGIPADMSQKWYNTNYPAPVQVPMQGQGQGQDYDEAAARQRMGSRSIMAGG